MISSLFFRTIRSYRCFLFCLLFVCFFFFSFFISILLETVNRADTIRIRRDRINSQQEENIDDRIIDMFRCSYLFFFSFSFSFYRKARNVKAQCFVKFDIRDNDGGTMKL